MKSKIIAALVIIMAPSVCFGAAGQGISTWPALAEPVADGDLLAGTDVSNTSGSDDGTSVKITATQLKTYMGNTFLSKSGGAMTGTFELGVASTTTGDMKFFNSSKAYSFTLFGLGADSPGIGWRLPATLPASTMAVTADTSGYLGYAAIPVVSDTAYDATSWNGNTDAATKDAIRDKIETIAGGSMTYPASGNIGYTTNGTSWSAMALDTDLTAVSASDDSVPSAKATKAYVDDTGVTINFDAGDFDTSGTDPVAVTLDATVARDTEVKAKYVSGTEADFYGTLLNPQNVYANDATNHAVTIINNVPAAFTITEISVSCDVDPTTELTATFQHKTAGVGYGTPTTIEAVLTVNGTATITSGIDDATIPAGTKVFMTLSDPDDSLKECAWQIEGDWD